MADALEATVQGIAELVTKAPALRDALDRALSTMAQAPRSVEERRAFEAWRTPVALAFEDVLAAVRETADASREVAAESRRQRERIAELEQRIVVLLHQVQTLEAENRAWQQEYEPSADPSRPLWFSNLRRAIAAIRG